MATRNYHKGDRETNKKVIESKKAAKPAKPAKQENKFDLARRQKAEEWAIKRGDIKPSLSAKIEARLAKERQLDAAYSKNSDRYHSAPKLESVDSTPVDTALPDYITSPQNDKTVKPKEFNPLQGSARGVEIDSRTHKEVKPHAN